jgi:hypothetical protein
MDAPLIVLLLLSEAVNKVSAILFDSEKASILDCYTVKPSDVAHNSNMPIGLYE